MFILGVLIGCGEESIREQDEAPVEVEDLSSYELVFTGVPASMSVGGQVTLQLEATEEGAKTDVGMVSWSTRSPEVITIDTAGVVTAVAPGRGFLVARTPHGEAMAEIQIR